MNIRKKSRKHKRRRKHRNEEGRVYPAKQEYEDNQLRQQMIAFAAANRIQISPRRTLFVDTILGASSLSVLPVALQLTRQMTQLDHAEVITMLGTPTVAAAFAVLALAKKLDNGSTIKEFMILRGVSQTALLALIILTATVKPADIPIAVAYILIGIASLQMACFMLNSHIIYCTPGDTSASLAKYAAICGMVPALLIALLQLVGEEVNLPATFGLIFAISFLGNFAALGLRESPYHKLIQLGMTEETAKSLAMILGQDKFPPPHASYAKTLFGIVRDPRTLGLCSAITSSFGVFLLLTTSTAEVLSHLDFTPANAAYTASGMSFLAMFVRYFSGPLLKRDPRGAKIYIIGSACTLTGSLMAGSYRPSPHLAYALAALILIAIGVGPSSAATFKLLVTWSSPQPNRNLDAYRVGAMAAFISFVGQLSGFALNAINAGIVSREDENSYADTFFLISSLALVSSIIVALTEISLTKPLWCMFHRASPVSTPALQDTNSLSLR